MVEDEWHHLRAHLVYLRPIITAFCARHGFEELSELAIGRYPRIRIEEHGEIIRWFDLWMCLDSDGERFTQVFQDTPYELSAGAFFDEAIEEDEEWRFQKSFVIWESKPYCEVAADLPGALEAGLVVLRKWDVRLLRIEGKRVRLRGK